MLFMREARADDTFILTFAPGADAGSLANTSSYPKNGEQLMLRCASHPVTVKFCDYAVTCSATANDTVVDADKSIDLCPRTQSKQMSLFRTYDGGVPSCRLYAVNPKTVCPP